MVKALVIDTITSDRSWGHSVSKCLCVAVRRLRITEGFVEGGGSDSPKSSLNPPN